MKKAMKKLLTMLFLIALVAGVLFPTSYALADEVAGVEATSEGSNSNSEEMISNEATEGTVRPAEGKVFRTYLDAANGRIVLDLGNIYFHESLVVELYSGSTFLASARLHSYYAPGSYPELTSSILIGRGTGENYTWISEDWTADKNVVPTEVRLVLDGETVSVNDMIYECCPNEDPRIGRMDAADWAAAVPVFVAKVGDGKYTSLQSAIDAAGYGDTVTLVSDIELTGTVTIAADDSIILDLNGKTISGVDTTNGNFSLISVNKGTLTVQGSGKIVLSATTDRGWSAYSSVISNNQGTVTIVSGTIEHDGGTSMAYAIDNLTNSGIGAATLYIEGGYIVSPYRAIRQFANCVKENNTLNVSGGTIVSTSGNKGAIWLQSPNSMANKAVLNITGGNVSSVYVDADDATGLAVSMVKEAKEVATLDLHPSYVFVEANGLFDIKKDLSYGMVAQIGDTYYATFQEAIDAATKLGGSQTITVLAGELSENVIVTQTAGVNITLNGNGAVYTGQIKVYGQSRSNGAETLTIENFAFKGSQDFIWSDNAQDGTMRYAHNVTVQNCTFETTGSASVLRIRQGFNIAVKDSTLKGMFSLGQLNACAGVTVDGVIMEDCGYGLNLGTSYNVTVANSTIHVGGGYGILLGASVNNSVLTVENCDITAGYPIHIYNVVANSTTLNVNGSNTITSTNGSGYWAIVTGANGYDATMPTAGTYTVNVNDTGLSKMGVYPFATLAVAEVGDEKYASLQEAIDAATELGGNQTVKLLVAEYAEDVIVKQTAGANITLDGNGATYTGTIYVHGRSRSKGAETLTIENFAFKASGTHNFIDSNSRGTAERYAHNVTIQNCTFEGNGTDSVVAVRIRAGYNITIQNVTAKNMFSLTQYTGCTNVVVDGVSMENCLNGVNLGTTFDAVVRNSTIVGTNGYGIAAEVSSNNSVVTVADCDIYAKVPVLVHSATANRCTLNVEGNNTFTATNENGYWGIITGARGSSLVAPTASYTVNLNDAGLQLADVYPFEAVATIGNTRYHSLQAAIANAESGDTITVVKDHTLALEPAEGSIPVSTNPLVHSLIYVNKSITIDLNGHRITADAASADESYIVVCVDGGYLVLEDSSNGAGSIAATGGSENLYALMMTNGQSGLEINGGSYALDDCWGGAMIYATDSETITINGGNFNLGQIGTGSNGSPWIFNVYGKNQGHVLINGGTFNGEVNRQYWIFETQMSRGTTLKEEGGMWTVVEAAAYVNKWEYSGKWYPIEVGYATLEEAIEAANTPIEGTYGFNSKVNYEGWVKENPETIVMLADGEISDGVVSGLIDPNGYNLEITGGKFAPAVSGEEVFYLNNYIAPGYGAMWNTEAELWEVDSYEDKVVLKITKQPEADVDVALNNWVKVSVEAKSVEVGKTGDVDGKLQYTWYFRDSANGKFQKSTLKTAEYSVILTAERVNREVYCVITDAYGNKVQTETVKLVEYTDDFAKENFVKVTADLVPADVTVGKTAKIPVIATGEGLTYQWYFRDSVNSAFQTSSIESSVYSVTVTAARANREIYCVVTDVYGNKVTTNTVKLIAGTELKITEQPTTDTVAKLGDVATLTIKAEGDGLTYQWYYRDSQNATWRASSIKTNVYKLTVKNTNASREVKCVVKDAHGNIVESEVVNLIDIPELVITKQPTDASAALGKTVSVSVEAEGDGLGLVYTWYYKDANQTEFTKSSITKNVYSIIMKESRINRQVYCVVRNLAGEVVTTNTVTLGVTK